MKKLLYRILKKDMIKKLSEKHGTQFVDDVMATFGMPTDTTNDYLKTLAKNDDSEALSCSCDNGIITCPGCYGEQEKGGVCAGCLGKGKVTCGKCGGNN